MNRDGFKLFTERKRVNAGICMTVLLTGGGAGNIGSHRVLVRLRLP